MDLTLDVEDYKLNIRAACIIEHDKKILFHRNMNSDHYCLIGGRIEIGESSEQTIKREILEEIGQEIEIKGYIATIENFFVMDEKKYHEIMFIYKAEFIDDNYKKTTDILYNIEGKDYLKYEWIDIDEIDKYPIKPKIAIDIIKERKHPIHKINIDRIFENK